MINLIICSLKWFFTLCKALLLTPGPSRGKSLIGIKLKVRAFWPCNISLPEFACFKDISSLVNQFFHNFGKILLLKSTEQRARIFIKDRQRMHAAVPACLFVIIDSLSEFQGNEQWVLRWMGHSWQICIHSCSPLIFVHLVSTYHNSCCFKINAILQHWDIIIKLFSPHVSWLL